MTVTCGPEAGSCTATAFSDDSSDTATFAPDNPTVPGGNQTVVDGSATFTLTVSPQAQVGDEEGLFVSLNCAGARSGSRAPTSAGLDAIVVDEKTDGGTESTAAAGDPISTYTGELYNLYAADLNLGGPMPLLFRRYYASRLLDEGHITGRLGNNWLHEFEWTLTTTPTKRKVVTNRGRVITFVLSGSSWVPRGRDDIPFRSKVDGNNFIVSDPRVNRMYTFADTGKLTAIADGRGNVHSLTYGGDLLLQVGDGLGRELNFSYDGAGRLVAVSDFTRTIFFDHTGDALTRVTDALGQVTTYAYAAPSRMASSTRPEGNTPFTQTWNANGQAVGQTDASGHATTLDYAAEHTTITDPTGATRVHVYEGGNGFLSANQDWSGQTVAYTPDRKNRLGTIRNRLGDSTSFTYHASSGRQASRLDPDGSTTSWSHSTQLFTANLAMYRPFRATYPDGTVESIDYDSKFNIVGHTDQTGGLTTTTYDGHGQPLARTNAAGGVTMRTYNADGTLASHRDPAGNTTTIGYDALRRPALFTRADGSTYGMVFDDRDRMTAFTDEIGRTQVASYDGNDRLTGITYPLGDTVLAAYDGNDRLLSVTGPLGGTTSVSYDAMGRFETLTEPTGSVTTFDYDDLGRIESATNALGQVRSATYDAEGRIASITDPVGGTTEYATDAMGRVTETTSPLGHRRIVDFDAMGRPIASTNTLGHTSTFSRDARGLLTGISQPGGIEATYARDALGAVSAVTDPNGNLWQRTHDNQGRRVSGSDPLGNTTTLTYDNRNRPSTISYPTGTGSRTLTYDAAGNLTASSWTGGPDLSYTYDALDRLLTTAGVDRSRDAHGRVTASNGIAIGYDIGGRVTSMTLAAGKTLTYAHDAVGRLSSVTDWLGGTTTFARDAAGRVTSVVRPNAVTTTYSYDADRRLVEIGEARGAVGLSSIALSRDGEGQITSATRDVPLASSIAGVTDLTLAFDAASQVASYTYDGRGRLTVGAGGNFVWDGASRLLSYGVKGITVSSTYDGLGRRLTRTSSGLTEEFVWNDALRLPGVSIERAGALDTRYHVHQPDGALIYSVDAATDSRHFYHFDEMGNTVFVTDDAGTIVAAYAYSPFGRRVASSGTLQNRFTWQGRFGVMDEWNGRYYVRARYYDSETARFISRDPVEGITPKAVNPYQYGLSNPLRFIDASGRQSVEPDYNAPVDLDAATALARRRMTAELELSRRLLKDARRENADPERIKVLEETIWKGQLDLLYGTFTVDPWVIDRPPHGTIPELDPEPAETPPGPTMDVFVGTPWEHSVPIPSWPLPPPEPELPDVLDNGKTCLWSLYQVHIRLPDGGEFVILAPTGTDASDGFEGTGITVIEPDGSSQKFPRWRD